MQFKASFFKCVCLDYILMCSGPCRPTDTETALKRPDHTAFHVSFTWPAPSHDPSSASESWTEHQPFPLNALNRRIIRNLMTPDTHVLCLLWSTFLLTIIKTKLCLWCVSLMWYCYTNNLLITTVYWFKSCKPLRYIDSQPYRRARCGNVLKWRQIVSHSPSISTVISRGLGHQCVENSYEN